MTLSLLTRSVCSTHKCRTLTIPQSPWWQIYLPTPHLVLIYGPSHIIAYELPDFSTLSPGRHPLPETPAWYTCGPVGMTPGSTQVYTHWHKYANSGRFCDPSSRGYFDLHFLFEYANDSSHARVITLKVDLNPAPSLGPNSPQFQWKATDVPDIAITRFGPGYRACLGVSRLGALRDDGNYEIGVVDPDDLVRSNGRGTLNITFPREVEDQSMCVGVDVDDFSGRVVVWGWSPYSPSTILFVGELA